MATNPTTSHTDFEARRREQKERHAKLREIRDNNDRTLKHLAQLLADSQTDRQALVERLSGVEPDDAIQAELEKIDNHQKEIKDKLTAMSHKAREDLEKVYSVQLRLVKWWVCKSASEERAKLYYDLFSAVLAHVLELESKFLERDGEEAKSQAKASGKRRRFRRRQRRKRGLKWIRTRTRTHRHSHESMRYRKLFS